MPSKRMRLLSLFCMWVGVVVFTVAVWGMLQKVEPFYTWFYSFAWWSYILFVNAFIGFRNGSSILFDTPRTFLALLPLSAAFWLIFEAFNFRLQNWHYLNLPASTALRWSGYIIAFATVLPGIFSTANLLDHLRIPSAVKTSPLKHPERLFTPFHIIGVLCLILPLVWPRYFFPLVWAGFIFLLEPLNYRLEGPSLLRDWQQGSFRNLWILLAAGACCGLLWEFWNFWAGSKWYYTVPYVGWLKIFEMPILGFLGFPPFAVECYVMTNAIFVLKRWIRERFSPPRAQQIWMGSVVVLILLDVAILLGIDRFTVTSFGG